MIQIQRIGMPQEVTEAPELVPVAFDFDGEKGGAQPSHAQNGIGQQGPVPI